MLPPELAEKGFRSPEDVFRSYQELERKLGQQGAELAALRAQPAPAPAAPEVSEDEFFSDPVKAVRTLLREELGPNREQGLVDYLNARHQGWQQTVESQAFTEWVMASKARQKLYMDASRNFDRDSAEELLTGFAATHRSTEARERETEDAVRRDRLLRASVTEGASGGSGSKKIYDSRWVQNLRTTNPDEYVRLMQGDLGVAYRENRVRR